MDKIRVCSLFSGIGGFETGLLQAYGRELLKVIFASEIDKFANRSYTEIYHHQPAGDIRQVHEMDIPDHDLLVAGFPCQAFSIAGKKLGVKDTRGTLFFEIARIAKEKKPRFMILENVGGLLSNEEGNTFKSIIQILSDLGYAVDFEILNSKFFDVPQNRERIIFVCILNGQTEEWAMNSPHPSINRMKKELGEIAETRSFNFEYPEQSFVSKRIYDILEPEVAPSYFMKDEVTSLLLSQIKQQFNDSYFTDYPDILKFMDIPKDILNDNERQRRVYNPNGIAPTVLARPDTAKILLVGYLQMKAGKQIRSVYDIDGVSPTVDTAQGGHRQIKILLKPDFQIRKLTPLECFRLQAIPEEYYHILRDISISDTQLYKMAGNAVTTNVIEGVARQLYHYF